MAVLKIPKNEIQWKTILKKGKPIFVITSNQLRDWYYLYEVDGEDYKKLGKARTPLELEIKFKVDEKMKPWQ